MYVHIICKAPTSTGQLLPFVTVIGESGAASCLLYAPLPLLGSADIMETKGKVPPYGLLMVLLVFSTGPLRLAAVALSGDLLKGGLASGELGGSPVLHKPGQVSLRGKPVLVKERVRGRMDIAVDDYPGSGANDRHDPRRG